MPTVPMYIQHPQATDASHGVFAPGGYEWWHFDAEDEEGEVRIAIDFYDGYPFEGEYVSRYERYLRRPTRREPPLPSGYPCVSMVVCQGDTWVASLTKLPAGSLTAATSNLHIEAGPNSVRRQGNDLLLRVSGSGSEWSGHRKKSRERLPISADLRFTIENGIPATEHGLGFAHRWVLADPLSLVEGAIDVGGSEQSIAFRGRGYHEHYYGAGPLQLAAIVRHVRGRVLTPGGFCAFHVARDHVTSAWKTRVVAGGAGGVRDLGLDSAAVTSLLSHADVIQFADVLRLERPKMIGATPHGYLMHYHATFQGMPATALCESIGPVTWWRA